jgi:hypothetical protein
MLVDSKSQGNDGYLYPNRQRQVAFIGGNYEFKQAGIIEEMKWLDNVA